MSEAAPPWWRFLPAGPGGSGARDILDAAGKGGGELSRTLRDVRDRLGAGRTASLMRAVESENGGRFGRPLRLLLVAGQQPRPLEDALRLGFAIAGFAVEIHAIEGVAALAEALDDESSQAFDGIELTLVFLQARPGGNFAVQADLVGGLALRIAARTLSPVVLARFVDGTDGEHAADTGQGVFPLPVPFVDAVFDDRFGASFGAILTSAAADRLADAAAAFAARIRGTAPKLVVTDLDGTLWSGILGEGDRPSGTAPPLHLAYAQALAAMRRRGLVLAIASRNDPADVARAFAAASPLSLDDFAACAIGWSDKAALVAEVLAELGLAPGHAVFVDDDPVNCARVAARFPEMDVRHFSGDPDAFAVRLSADPLLAGEAAAGEERTEQYRRRAEVERLRTATPDIAAFLAGLRTTVTVLPLGTALLPRAAELGARINQFRFTALSPAAQALARRNSPLDFMVRLDDAFGPHGLVGLVLASRDGDAARIDNLLLSCRALERGIETTMLHALARLAAREGCASIVARIEVLPRNEPARTCLSRHGFIERSGEWVYDLGPAHGTLADAPAEVRVNWNGSQEAGEA